MSAFTLVRPPTQPLRSVTPTYKGPIYIFFLFAHYYYDSEMLGSSPRGKGWCVNECVSRELKKEHSVFPSYYYFLLPKSGASKKERISESLTSFLLFARAWRRFIEERRESDTPCLISIPHCILAMGSMMGLFYHIQSQPLKKLQTWLYIPLRYWNGLCQERLQLNDTRFLFTTLKLGPFHFLGHNEV